MKKDSQKVVPRRTLWDALDFEVTRNNYCNIEDLTNEASVETFFVSRMLWDLGFRDAHIKTKESIDALIVGRGHARENFKPDYVLFVNGEPRCVIDAKSPAENIDKWVSQCCSYCLSLNRRSPDSNPVKYFILSNGYATKVFEWDKDEPVLSMEFADFDWGNHKYEQLKSLITPNALVETTSPRLVNKSQQFALVRPSSEQARQLFANCHKIIWKAEGFGPAPAFMQFVKIMFVKLWCDRKLREDVVVANTLTGDSNQFKVPTNSVTFSVDWIESREKEGAVNPIDSMLFDRLRDELEREISLRRKKRLFGPDEHIDLKSHTIKQVVRKLEHFDMFGIDEDLNGRLFETFLSATMRGRELGQFFTPRSVVKMMARVAGLQVSRKHQDKVIDACCGSGGFLIEALTVMRNQVRENVSFSLAEKENLLEIIANECLFGVDFGKDPPLARIARINMYLHGDGGSRIYYADALDKALRVHGEENAEVVRDVEELRTILENPAQFDVVLTNPPFSMTKEASNDADREVLEHYSLARKDLPFKALRPSLRSNVMFLERYHELLRPGGKLVTVIDDTLLASDKDMFVSARHYIRERFIIRAIISLPGDSFRRSGARVKTSVLLLEKKNKPDDAQPPCFAYFAEHIGVDDLTPRASDHEVQEVRSKAESEIQAIVSGYENYLAGKNSGVLLSPERLRDRLDLKYCAPQFGRLASQWEENGIAVKPLSKCVKKVEDAIDPRDFPDQEFTLIKVTYGGRCEIERVRQGRQIKAKTMYQVKTGQLVFSTIRATDGAIGIVPEELDGALVSGSYSIFDAGTPEDTAYLWAVLRSHELRADMQSLSPGSGRYTTYWPLVGEVLIPWLKRSERHSIGGKLIEAWAMESAITSKRNEALAKIQDLGVESQESIGRWRASKAPT